MSKRRMTERVGQVKNMSSGKLSGFYLAFNKAATGKKGIGFANIMQSENTITEGILYDLYNFEQLRILDKKEGYPEHYNRVIMEVETYVPNRVEAWVYVAQPEYINNYLKPSREYLEFLLEGKDYLSKEYLEKLKSFGVR